MRKAFATFILFAGLFALAAGQAVAVSQHGSAKTVTVVMHDPGCHWFSVGGKFLTKLTVTGPVSLANYDEAALKVAGPTGVKRAPVGKKISLGRGIYKITMVGQASDDNTLKLTVK
jgi:hypothetical protein